MATTRCWRRATSCSAWPRRASCWPACAPTAWKTRRSCARHRPRQGQRAGRGLRRHQRRHLHRASARPTSTTSRARAGCSAWWCRPMRRSACSPTTSCASTRMNNRGQLVPLSAFASTRWITGPMQTIRYNGYPTMRIAGDAAPGVSTGDAMAEMERLAAQLPPGFGFEWTGQSREERLAGATAHLPVRLLAAGGVPVPGGAVRELVDPVRGAAGGAAGRARRGARHRRARLQQRRVLQDRPDHHHRPVGEERGADHRVRQGPAGAGAQRRCRRCWRRRTCASGRSS